MVGLHEAGREIDIQSFRYQSTENGDGAQRVRFGYHNGLEPAFQCLVLFEVLLIFVQSSGSDAAELTTGQGGF